MKSLIVTFLTFFLLQSLMAFADDDKLEKIDTYTQTKGDKLQEYKKDIPQYGNYYEWDGKRWQRYERNIPQYGDYLKKTTKQKQN